jgi:hypothetical protein
MSTVIRDAATPFLSALHRQVSRPRGLMAEVGKAVEVAQRDLFLARNREPNKKNWPKQNFWKKEGFDRTRLDQITDNTALIRISSAAIALKARGGEILPKRGKYLSIPLRPEAYGKSPRARNDRRELFLLKPRSGRRFAILAKREGKAIRAHYLLVPRVAVQKDPRAVLPSAEVVTTVNVAAARYLQREISRLQGGSS